MKLEKWSKSLIDHITFGNRIETLQVGFLVVQEIRDLYFLVVYLVFLGQAQTVFNGDLSAV